MSLTRLNPRLVNILRPPVGGERIVVDMAGLRAAPGSWQYRFSESGIRKLIRAACLIDESTRHSPGIRLAGLQVVGTAEKPSEYQT